MKNQNRMRYCFLFVAMVVFSNQAFSAQMIKVLSCGGGNFEVFKENGEYGNFLAHAVLTDANIADYVSDGHFNKSCPFERNSIPNYFTESCRLENRSLVVPMYTDYREPRGFSWMNSSDFFTDLNQLPGGNYRIYRLTAWKVYGANYDGSAVRFQLISNEGVVGIDCGPSGEGPCNEVIGSLPKVTSRDWLFRDCRSL